MAGLDLKPKAKRSGYFTDWDRNLLSLIHELSGPLTAANLSLDKYLGDQDEANLEMLKTNISLMEDYLKNARQLIKRLPVTTRPFSVNKQLANLIKNLSPVANQRSVGLRLNSTDDYVFRGNPTRFKQIISCFIRNAIDAYDDSLSLDKTVLVEHYILKDYLTVCISDRGSGIKKEDKAKIFKPYYSTKRTSSELGLGLSLAAESIHQDFSGYIKVESTKGTGTIFRLYFKLPDKHSMLK